EFAVQAFYVGLGSRKFSSNLQVRVVPAIRSASFRNRAPKFHRPFRNDYVFRHGNFRHSTGHRTDGTLHCVCTLSSCHDLALPRARGNSELAIKNESAAGLGSEALLTFSPPPSRTNGDSGRLDSLTSRRRSSRFSPLPVRYGSRRSER